MDAKLQGRRQGPAGRRWRLLRVAAMAAALSVLPPLQLASVPADATPGVPAVTLGTQYAEARPLHAADVQVQAAAAPRPDDSSAWRVRTGFILLLLSALGTVTLRLWMGALRRTF